MFILSKRNIILPSPDGKQSVRVARDFVGEIPDWAAQTSYFRALVADGKIVPTTHRDKDQQEADEVDVVDHTRDENAEPEASPEPETDDPDSKDNQKSGRGRKKAEE